MKALAEYLNDFKGIADEWFAKADFLGDNYEFFQQFFKKEKLAECEWSDIQQIGDHIHSFTHMEIARQNALGKPNHPIEHYRKSFMYLAHGSDPVEERIRNFTGNTQYKLRHFGESAVSEILGNLFADKFVLFNDRDKFALELLGVRPPYSKGDDFVARLLKFNRAIVPVVDGYRQVVGQRTSLPLNFEIDQFFNYLYETYHRGHAPDTPQYWWLNANPKIWNFTETSIGARQTYTSHNEKGNKRQKYKYFQEVKPGDIVVGYVTSPHREIVALCKVTKGLHTNSAGEQIEFEKVEQLTNPISYDVLQSKPALAHSEPLINHQGSLFKLTKQEYEVIHSLIEETHLATKAVVKAYSKQTALKELFVAENQFDEMLTALKEKKNVVLQGAPGVGKTFVARRLAWAFIGADDPHRVEMIQFHQSYSYEDFIQGFRPTSSGQFDLKSGIFYQFCHRAQEEESTEKPFVFIIDEINRGNLSKIFGELMMLVEPDKRGRGYAIPLAYSQDANETFYIPENVHLIGTMNTADRSLAMVDYALRRRFRFITLKPEFSSKTFQAFMATAGAEPRLVKKIVDRMNRLNEIIAADSKNLGPGYQIGHSYFCPPIGVLPDEDWYRRVIEAEIVPLIQEYWFDNEGKVKQQLSALLA